MSTVYGTVGQTISKLAGKSNGRKDFQIDEKKKIVREPLIEVEKVLLPFLQIKLGSWSQVVKSFKYRSEKDEVGEILNLGNESAINFLHSMFPY